MYILKYTFLFLIFLVIKKGIIQFIIFRNLFFHFIHVKVHSHCYIWFSSHR